MKILSAFFEVIEASLQEHPDEWEADDYDIQNVSRGVSVWTRHAIKVRVGSPGGWAEIPTPLRWRFRLRKAVNFCLAKQAIEKFKR